MKLSYDKADVCTETVNLPLSKSIGARALILAHIYGGAVMLQRVPDCDDSHELAAALEKLAVSDGQRFTYDLGSGGTSLRFFLALAASSQGFRGDIDCSDGLRSRPIAPLVDALRSAGAQIEYKKEEGRPPLRVQGRCLRGTDMVPGAAVSSQYVSALLMASLLWNKRYEPQIAPQSVSAPYIRMTREMMRQFAELSEQAKDTGCARIYTVEADWSSASYFYEFVLAEPSASVRLRGLLPEGESLQGDNACAQIYSRLGVRTIYGADRTVTIEANAREIAALSKHRTETADGKTVRLNLRETPDLVPSLAVGMCLVGIRYEITGIGHLRYKESDRIAVLCSEMRKAGYLLQPGDDSLSWSGERCDAGPDVPVFDAHGDHRMAMALSVMAVKKGEIIIKGERCVEKSFPRFFDELHKLGFRGEGEKERQQE